MESFGETPKVIGTKQTLKAVKEGKATVVVLAEDTEDSIKEKIVTACQEASVPIESYESKITLGQDSGIERGAAVIALLK
ncbi:ribosomal L7Ae/L30e/S12e/Gadd45 family protein [Eubacterium limosum]|uniref:ribosomal L7Ae/L30e/S12e/Gadd45 family protein n=1 Tax=Eubacterium limosum TaxID=1736 RepID=UPI0022E6FB99|nr:ribosomal L7Ae/L30e/S12e/Gadd45 family protein [Eubacterium limosum]